jgi:TetR/AcrR family transcriptional regulator, repressor for uid operon
MCREGAMKKLTRKADARRSEILAAAAGCFREKGLKAASISDICARLKISPGHLYYYFESKDALVEEMFLRVQQSVVGAVQALAAQEDALDVLLNVDPNTFQRQHVLFDLDEGTMLEFYAEATRNPRLSKIVQAYWSSTTAQLRPLLEVARKTGRIRNERDLETVTDLLIMYFCALPLSRIGDPGFDPVRYRRSLQSMIAPFVAPAKQRRTRRNPSGRSSSSADAQSSGSAKRTAKA